MAILRRFANLFRRASVDREINDELQSHIALRIDDNIANGMSPEEARRDALVRFGNPTTTKEHVAAADANLSLGAFGRNVVYALRQLRRSPGFALAAILTLALGIGPNVAIFSIVWATFLAPLPYPNADQLVVVWTHYKGERSPSREDDFAQYAAESRSFEHLDFLSWRAYHLTNPDHTEDEITGNAITPQFYLHQAKVDMQLGRHFLSDEGLPGKDHVVILMDRLWRERYYADPNVLGKSILIDNEPYMVVGVLRPVPTDRNGAHFIVPVIHPAGVHSEDFGNIFGHLKPGVTLAQAQAELAVIDRRLASQRFGGLDASSWSVSVEQLKNDWLDRKIQRNLWLLLSAVGLVLLIACANVANLLLARGASRRQELAVRSALGASRRQIFVQLLTESLTLAAVGGIIGVGLGWGIMKLAMAILPELTQQSTEVEVGMNIAVLCFAVGISLLAGVLFGCAPGWQATQQNLSDTLKQGSRFVGGRGRASTQSVLVVVEIALALVLLSGAGMALHSFWNLSRVDLGFNADHVISGRLAPRVANPQGGVPTVPPPEQIAVQQHQLLDHIRAVPGVENAALATSAPMSGDLQASFAIAGQTVDRAHPPVADFEAVTPGYFNTFGVRLVRGRFIGENDTLSAPPVAMVNETFARRFLPNQDPLAQRLILPRIEPGTVTGRVEYQVIGVFHDVLNDEHLTGTVQPQMIVPLWQVRWPWVAFGARTAVDPGAVTGGLRSAVASAAPNMAIRNLEVMQRVVDAQRSGDRFAMVLFGGFAAVALLLAAVGISGVMAFAVVQRTHEIGVRMALGAERSEVVMLLLRGGMRLALLGVGIGLIGAYLLGRMMHATLYKVQAIDAGSISVMSALLLAVAAVACWLPARRSASVDPMKALRNE